MIVVGKQEELKSIMRVLAEFANSHNKHSGYCDEITVVANRKTMVLSYIHTNFEDIDKQIDKFLPEECTSIEVKFTGEFWGHIGGYDGLKELLMFEKMAEAAPNAFFEGKIESFCDDDICQQVLKAKFENGILYLKHECEYMEQEYECGDDDEEDECWDNSEERFIHIESEYTYDLKNKAYCKIGKTTS